MKTNYARWSVVIGIIAAFVLGGWLAGGLALAQSAPNETAETPLTGVSGNTAQTDRPVISPLGNSAGPIIDAKSKTVAQVLAGLETTTFNALVAETGASSEFTGEGRFTVFAPTNGAFSQLMSGTLPNMTASEKARLAKHHIVVGNALDADVLTAGSVQANSGDQLNFTMGVNGIAMVGSAIVITQYNAKNGVVYTVDNVLLPPKR